MAVVGLGDVVSRRNAHMKGESACVILPISESLSSSSRITTLETIDQIVHLTSPVAAGESAMIDGKGLLAPT